MLGAPKTVTLFGRFKLLPRAQVGQLLQARGAREVKDLTRTSDLLAVGSGATNLIASGALGRRLSEASSRQIPIY
ncbi:MAG: hypothetical protein AAFV38_08070 [Pseudomonadota bacterium]